MRTLVLRRFASTSFHNVSTSSEASSIQSFDQIPGPKGLPFLGTLATYRKRENVENYADILLKMYKTYGPIVKENIGWGRGYVVHVFDPGKR